MPTSQQPSEEHADELATLKEALAEAADLCAQYAIEMRQEAHRTREKTELLSKESLGPWGCVYCKIPVPSCEIMAKHHAYHCSKDIERANKTFGLRPKFRGDDTSYQSNGKPR